MESKVGYEVKLVRSFSRMEPQKLGLAVVAGCFAVSLLFAAAFRAPTVNPTQMLGLRVTMPGGSRTMVVVEDEYETSSTRSEGIVIKNSTQDDTAVCATSQCQNDHKSGRVQEDSPVVSIPPPQEPATKDNSELLDVGSGNSTLGNRLECDGSLCKDLQGSSSSLAPASPTTQENVTTSSTQSAVNGDSAASSTPNYKLAAPDACDPKSDSCEVDGGEQPGSHHRSPDLLEGRGEQNMQQEGELSCDPKSGLCKIDGDQESQTTSLLKFSGGEARNDEHEKDQKPMQSHKPLCDTSEPAFDICDVAGDVRILGNSSSVHLVDVDPAAANESWRIRPYARKTDNTAMGHVRQVLVSGGGGAAACAVRHDVPAVVFSVSGYTGNFFHDFTDVLIPLFLTARQFNGEVQLLVTDYSWWWVNKYRLIFQQLTRYDIVDLDRDDKVRCYPRAIVGLRRHKELSIDPSKLPRGISMADFARFLRTAFSLERETVAGAAAASLLIISRKKTRSLVNVRKVVQVAQKVGFEVVVGETGVGSDVATFARVVNSCDVLMGVHGAGLTNLVFLPANGTLIQIVPWGGLEGVSRLDFGDPAADAHLTYVQYAIKAEESTLIQQYPREHPVFKDPVSIHRQGWEALSKVFLVKQNVRLDMKRFRPVLQQVLSDVLLRRRQ